MYTRLGLLLFLTSIVSSTRTYANLDRGHRLCENLILEDGTERFISYLEQLLENQVIGLKELVTFFDRIEKDNIGNLIDEKAAKTHASLLISRDGIEEYLVHTRLNQARLRQWALDKIKEKRAVQEKRDQTRQELDSIDQKMIFHPVPSGSFEMTDGERKTFVTLSFPFEAMSTQVTQRMWVELMGENPSVFINGEDSIFISVNGKKIKVRPNNPVEHITWWSALVFANKLSEKLGLQPVYDLSQITFKDQSLSSDEVFFYSDDKLLQAAAKGTLAAVSLRKGPLINARDHDFYKAQGYRLPTNAEQEYLLRGAGKIEAKYLFGDDKTKLGEHVWYDQNSSRSTHPVAELEPLLIDGKRFYDLQGNVFEWTQDWHGDVDGLRTINISEIMYSSQRNLVVRGGCWKTFEKNLNINYTSSFSPEDRYSTIGFRLVRTLSQ